MEYQNLGESGLKVSKVIVGCMSFGLKSWATWAIEDEEEVFKILKKCYDVGLRTFDTADAYSNGRSEILLGKFMKKFNIPRDKIVILTKVFFPVEGINLGEILSGDQKLNNYELANSQGLSRKHILDAVEESVKRLGTYIDVLQIHRLDNSTPKTEIMRALNDVVIQGSVRYLGASSMKVGEFAQLQHIADKNGWFKFISMQNFHNLLYREGEREMIPFCNESEFGKVSVIPWSPIARGLLARPIDQHVNTGRINSTDDYFKAFGLYPLSKNDQEIVNRVEKLSKEKNVSMAVIATAWVMQKGCFPIVGINSEKRAEDILEAFKVKFTDEELKYLEEPYLPKPFIG
ncbi:unnamed protein product [Debaryomyces tyrocola]|nr:unnamed protein product [Debaryomyces tyrocola]